jgi:parallel beta-helix repeat protein
MRIYQSNGSQLTNNTVHSNSSGIELETTNNNLIRVNDVRFNSGGIELKDASDTRVEMNTVTGNTATGITSEGVALRNVVAQNVASGQCDFARRVDLCMQPRRPDHWRIQRMHQPVDANPGDGLCATATGECTLRADI